MLGCAFVHLCECMCEQVCCVSICPSDSQTETQTDRELINELWQFKYLTKSQMVDVLTSK